VLKEAITACNMPASQGKAFSAAGVNQLRMPEEEQCSEEELNPEDPERKKRMEDVRKVCMRRRRAPEEQKESQDKD
jgi:hypothetical protein